MTVDKSEITTDLGLVALAAIWGINFSVVKFVLETLDPLSVNALRFPLAAAALTLVVWRSPARAVPRREDVPRIILLGFLGNLGYQLCFIFGIDWTRAGNASLLLATTPIWTLIFSAAAGYERPTRWASAGVFGTVAGMSLVVFGSGDRISLGSESLRGDLLMVMASILWSIYTVAGQRPVSRYGALHVTTWALWVGTPFLVLMGLPSLATISVGEVSPGAWLGIAYAGLLSIGLAYLLWYRGVQRLGNNRTAVYSNLVPVAALVTAWLWLGEKPTSVQLVGAGIILSGLTVARFAQSPGGSSPARSVNADNSAR